MSDKGKVRHIAEKQLTPEGVLRQLLSDVENIEAIVVIGRRKGGEINFAWSGTPPADRSHLALALQARLMGDMVDDVE